MIARIIRASIANRALVLIAAVLLAVAGLWSVRHTPLDALPDLSDTQVIIRTEWGGQTPRIIEAGRNDTDFNAVAHFFIDGSAKNDVGIRVSCTGNNG